MNKLIRHLLLLSIAWTAPNAVTGIDELIEEQYDVASAVANIDPKSVELYLFSITPNQSFGKIRNSDKYFHGYRIIGWTEIKDTEEKRSLLNAFSKGISENTNSIAACFNPRHGIRIIKGDTGADFVICFSCLQVEAHGFLSYKSFLTSATPRDFFDTLLKRHRVPLAKY